MASNYQLKIEIYIALIVFIAILGMLYYFYDLYSCKYDSLASCIQANSGNKACGDPQFSGLKEDCEEFVKTQESCFCKSCNYCLTKEQREICKLSQEERIKTCLAKAL